MKVLTTEQIRLADEYTINHEPLLSLDLMERAALQLSDYLAADISSGRIIRIFAGSGNNGGDGIALARLLARKGMPVFLHLLKPAKAWSTDAQANIDRLPDTVNLKVDFLKPGMVLPVIHPSDLVVDAIFGSGLTREPEGFAADLIDHINSSGAQIISIDIPSGLFGENNDQNSRKHTIKADITLSFQFPRLAFFFPENADFAGEWKVLPIGLHPDFIKNVETPWNITGFPEVKSWLKVRSKFSHKGTFGHSLLLAGSTGKTGAAVLAASACVRSGTGLTTVAVPSSATTILQTAVPEAMLVPDSDSDRLTRVPELSPFSAIGAGPGIGTDPSTWTALQNLLKKSTIPLVLDADALNLLSQNPGSLRQVPKNSILTPHPGEFKRLFGEDTDDFSRVVRMKSLAEKHNLVIVLKGAHTAVAGQDGSVWFNSTGNPGMATGGSGDVLTGLITGLVARGYDTFTAARLGVFIHGLAGDVASEDIGYEALTASDIVGSIGKAFLRIQNYPI